MIAEGCPVTATYAVTRQAAIVKYLAAHLALSALGGQKTQRALGDASETQAPGVLGMTLSGTTYGQQALALDTSGCLARLGRPGAKFEVL